MIRTKTFAVAGLALFAAACGGGASAGGKGALPPGQDSGKKTAGGAAVSTKAAANFESALKQFVAKDKAGEWSPGDCKSVASAFLTAEKEQKSATGKAFPEALYNTGLAYQRCGMDAEALKQFKAAQAADKNFHRARAQLALYDFNKSQNFDGAISNLERIIRDAKFQNVEALVSVAALQMERGSDQSNSDGKDDLERAKKNIQRALAIDDSFMPAFNQLAIYYLELAKRKAGREKARGKRGRRRMEVSGGKKKAVNQQMLDLAALVTAQAIRKNPKYAAIHNTAGLIQVELKNFNGAVKSFKRARDLDPRFFEAHMNYAAVSLSFRGFSEAEKAYRSALKLKPKEFEAHLGLALALRGQINDSNWDKAIAESEKHLKEARKLAPDRPETYYNEAILTQEFKAKGSQDKAIPALERAAKIYRDFIAKAGSDPIFAEAVKRSKDRSQDIEDTVKFIKEGEKLKKAEAAAAAAKKAAPPPPPPKK